MKSLTGVTPNLKKVVSYEYRSNNSSQHTVAHLECGHERVLEYGSYVKSARCWVCPEPYGLDMIPETLPEMVERVQKDPFDPKKLNRPCYRCGAPYGAHAAVDERCPEGNWYSKTDTFLDLGPAHDQWVTGDRNC